MNIDGPHRAADADAAAQWPVNGGRTRRQRQASVPAVVGGHIHGQLFSID
jgi:hypothetical protein